MLAQLGSTENIEILTKTNVLDCTRHGDGYRLRISQGPRCVDPQKCVACGLCAKKCPACETVMSPFHDRRQPAIRLPSMNAIPRGYVIDEEICLFFKDGSCRECERVCPKGAVSLGREARQMELGVAGVILASGASPVSVLRLQGYGYGDIPDVMTNLEFEEMLNPAGPTGGTILRPSSGKRPERIAWIQCVGSRQINQVNRTYCSSICCITAMKQAVTSRQLVDPPPETHIYYTDLMAHQKGGERYLRRAIRTGVRFIRSRPHSLGLGPDGRVVIEIFEPQSGRQRRSYDMVVLSAGIAVSRPSEGLVRRICGDSDDFGFNLSPSAMVEATSRRRIFACGTVNGPKSIPGAVIEGSAAAALLRSSMGELPAGLPAAASGAPEPVELDPPRIGVFLCSCGTNIGSRVSLRSLARRVSSKQGRVLHTEVLTFACSPDGADAISAAIRKMRLNRIVIAACSPRSHKSVFQQAMEGAGLDPSMLVVANVREQGVWAHGPADQGLEARLTDQILMAAAKAGVLSPYSPRRYPVERRVVVVGGGLSGLACAALTAEAGFPTVLVEKTARLGGNALSVMRSWRGLDVSAEVERLKKRLGESHLAQVLTESTVQAIHGPTGKFSVLVQSRRSGTVESFQAGAVVIATGAREARPSGHLYGEHPGVLTHQDLDRMLMEGDEKGLEEAKCLVFIQCVGSCDDGRPYCSRVCCTHSVTRAVYLKERFPRLDIYILYKHMRTYGQRDEYFRRARRMGIRIVRFGHGSPPRLTTVTGLDRSLRPVRRLKVECSSELLDSDLVIHPDYVILASAIEPDAENNQSLSALLKLPLGPDGFFQEGHPKLRPAELRRDGFFVAGLAHYPKEVEESLSQAAAAASKAMAFVSKGETTLDRHTAVVFPELCDGCALCIDVCKEQAVSLVEFVFGSQVKAMAEIDDSICTGCGACVAVCPKYALGIPDYMPDEMAAQINFLLGEEYET